MPAFETYPLWLNGLLFAVGGVLVWFAGARLSLNADVLAERSGLGHAFIGALLLGGITSLPEAATTISASYIGNAPLAVNNIFGGIALQVAVLAMADLVMPGPALTARIAGPNVMLQGALLVLVLTVAAAGIVAGDVLVLGVGLWATGVFVVSVLAFFLMHASRERTPWMPRVPFDSKAAAVAAPADTRSRSTGAIVLGLSVAALVILGAGFLLAQTGDALAEQTGLGSGFVGAVLVAVATSLPEISTTFAAVRLGSYAMAVSNIFGANILDAAILFLADVVYPGPAVLNEVGLFTAFGAILGIAVTAVYLVGLLERRQRVVLGMGVDSLLVLLTYLGGVAVLYGMR
jgi:cation:H+ antiporter